MILFNMPIKRSQTTRIVADWLWNLLPRRRTLAGSQITFVYFSCQADFDCLRRSLSSLTRAVAPELIGAVYVFVDQNQPFTREQIEAFDGLIPSIQWGQVHNFRWASTETTMAELDAFQQVSRERPATELIAKTDSDVLFIVNSRMQRLAGSKLDAIGDGHYVRYEHAQGGLYFIRASRICDSLSGITAADVKAAERACGHVGEDAVISQLLAQAGHPFYLTRLMLYPDEYRKVARITRFVGWEFCAAHCMQDKQNMPQIDKKLNRPCE